MPVEVEVSYDPFTVSVIRDGSVLIDDLSLFTQSGSGKDRLIELTEGVIPEEERGDPEPVGERRPRNRGDGRARPTFSSTLEPDPRPFRLGATWPLKADARLTGLGARHCEPFDQRGRVVHLGADRRYTGPIARRRCSPTGGSRRAITCRSRGSSRTRAGPFGSRPTARASSSTSRRPAISQRGAAGGFRLHLLTDPTPAARLRHYLRLTGFPPVLAEWAYGHWKSRDVYEHQRDVLDDVEGYERHDLPLDAIVIDSPWETQYNTWRFNPHQFPDPQAMLDRLREGGVRTVVWITPWVNLDSTDGQRPPDPESERLHRRPAPNYAEALWAGNFIRGEDGGPHVGRWWMGIGSPLDFTSAAARRWWKKQARHVLEMGVEGIKADDGEGYYIPAAATFADRRRGAEAGWAHGDLYRRVMQEVLDEVHPGTGVLFGRCGWSGQQATGITWGGDQVSDFWSLRTLLTATLTAAASGFSNWSHDVGGYLGHLLVERCQRELLLRWVQFGCFTPLMQAHGRFAQEAWRYDERTLDTYRSYILLHERLVPYIRAAAATAARSGLPIIRPLPLTDPGDELGWTMADAYGFGPSFWVAPVLEGGARERRVWLPRGDWIDFWTREQVVGGDTGRWITADAPRERIPAWVRRGAIVVTHPAAHVASGLGFTPESERPLEATLWGEPRAGRATARLTDGTSIRWREGDWSVSAKRDVRFFGPNV